MPFSWCDIIDKILDVHGRKMVYVRAPGTLKNGEKNHMYISLNIGWQNCFFYFDIKKIGIIVKRRFYSFILHSVII